MAAAFDPYHKWLGIAPAQRPPTHYQLLGIAPDERDREVIEVAGLRQSGFVRAFQVGAFADEATRLLNEIAVAQICLRDPAKRAAYDRTLAGSVTSVQVGLAAPTSAPAAPPR
ncbi:MAG TPA: hypothetical protein VGX78_12390, partial [Pirellulales bacterium]|nr:hypothetical protein [Pirellulales bacterium]